MEKLCIGIIGAGMIADMHIDNIILDGRGFVKWVNARTQVTVSKKMEKYGIQNGTTDYREILADPQVKAVIIATPPDTHVNIQFDALDAGKHVLLEKPMCIRREDIDRVLKKVAKHPNQVVLECSARYTRLNPKFKYVRQMIRDGKLGDIYYIHYNAVNRQSRPGIEYNPGAYWFLDKAQAGGGPFFDLGEYDLAFHLGLFDTEPELVSFKSFMINGLDNTPHGAPVFDVEEHAVAMMEFSNGLKYYYETAMNAHNEAMCQTRIYGTKGGLTLSYHPWDSNELEYYYVDEDGKGKAQKQIITLELENESSQEFEILKHFLDCVLDGATPEIPVELAAKHLDIIFQITE